MTRPRIGAELARAAADQLRNGRADISVLLGAHAGTPGHFADDSAVRLQIEIALAGGDTNTSSACLRHLGDLRTCALDVAIVRAFGADPAVTLFLLACLGTASLERPDRGEPLRLTRNGSAAAVEATFGDVTLTCISGRHMIATRRLPDAVVATINGRIAERRVPLAEVLSHRILDRFDLAIQAATTGDGAGVLSLADDEALAWRPARDVITETMGRSS